MKNKRRTVLVGDVIVLFLILFSIFVKSQIV